LVGRFSTSQKNRALVYESQGSGFLSGNWIHPIPNQSYHRAAVCSGIQVEENSDMRHLKRFKNWLAVVYYACWANNEQYRNKTGPSHQVDLSMELEADVAAQLAAQQAEDKEVSVQQQQAALEMLDAIAGTTEKVSGNKSSVDSKPVVESKSVAARKPFAPAVEVKNKNKVVTEKPVEVSAPVPAKPKAPAAVSPNGKPQGTNGGTSDSQSTTGKYQPGAINEQTAQRLARLLVSEIKLYHKSKSEGEDPTDGMNIYDALRDPIEKSRQHYKQRMGKTAIETMPDYFHGELVRSLCGGDASRLGPNYHSLDESA
jgi:hypothetical protein